MLSVELLGVGAHGVLDYRSRGAVVLGELLDQIGDVLGHLHPQLDCGFPARLATPALGRGRRGRHHRCGGLGCLNDYEVSDRGRLHQSVKDAYYAAKP